jgi:hypothetical protein
MERLARAQARKAGGAEEGAVEEIRRIELDTAWGEFRRTESAKLGSGTTSWGELTETGTGITEWTTLR